MNNLILLFIIVPALAVVLLSLNFLLSPHKPDEAKLSIYECGFQTIPLQGVKSKDWADFCKAVEIIRIKKHLTNEGLDLLHKLKLGMNRGRE